MSTVGKGSDADTAKNMILGTVFLLVLLASCAALAVHLTPVVVN
ncbi:hypothetical protein SAMN05216339_102294 [Nitrosomonas eutropha]|uniref:Uncharacterized protein n=1 Tax=Nitrosomonas eutropha TaxID=916 RepID=A0A1I7G953_9PROT|nr:hypothetical protein [Nitrosomonas eutropha]SFU44796.1 hypothetical protein SAMN05216339_102294 [Nitrosomonas eutropha]